MQPPNLDFLLKNSDLKEEDICKMTVEQIRRAEKAIIERQIVERRNDPELMERYRKFFRAYDDFVKIFGKELTDKYLPIVPLERLTNDYFWSDQKPYHKYFEKIRDGQYTKKISKGAWVKEERTSGTCYRVSTEYQVLEHATIIRAILAERVRWLGLNFKYSCYQINGNGWDELYVQTSPGEPDWIHLYVPYEALLKYDANAIIKRNNDYLTGFHKDTGEEDYKTLMARPITIKFFEMLEEAKQEAREDAK